MRNAAGPMLGVCVSVLGTSQSGSASTSITGQYRVTGLASGEYSVTVSTDACDDVNLGNFVTGWSIKVVRSNSCNHVTVRAGRTTTGVNLDISPDGEISGVVTAATGAPH